MITNNLSLESFLSGSTKSAVAEPVENMAVKTAATATEGANKFDSAVNLDLSEEAKKILQQLQQKKAAVNEPEFKQPFNLNNAQKNKITEIIKSFKDEPLTKETFTKISDALKDAGFASDKLAVMNSAASFKSTSFLAAILGGETPVIPTAEQSMASMRSKQTEYMQAVFDYWNATTNATPEETAIKE